MIYNVLSLGAGVQSSTLALMANEGIIPIDYAVFADTGHEPTNVYKWLEWLISELNYPVHIVSKGDLAADSLKLRVSKKSGKTYCASAIPAFIRNKEGKKGMLTRQCTRDYKVFPVRKFIRKDLRYIRTTIDPTKPWGKGNIQNIYQDTVVLNMGISVDEAHRQKESPVPFATHKYPLIEMGMSRTDCLTWMQEHDYPTPPRSSCYFCPYHSDTEWLNLSSEDFKKAVEFEKSLQSVMEQQNALFGTPYLHSSLVSLDKVEFKDKENRSQLGNECEGMCGV